MKWKTDKFIEKKLSKEALEIYNQEKARMLKGNSFSLYKLHKECKKRCDKKKLDFPLTYKDIAEDVELPIYETAKPNGKKQKVAVTYEVCGYVEVEGETMQEAMENFNKNIDFIALPTDIEYVDGSFQLSSNDVEEMKELANC